MNKLLRMSFQHQSHSLFPGSCFLFKGWCLLFFSVCYLRYHKSIVATTAGPSCTLLVAPFPGDLCSKGQRSFLGSADPAGRSVSLDSCPATPLVIKGSWPERDGLLPSPCILASSGMFSLREKKKKVSFAGGQMISVVTSQKWPGSDFSFPFSYDCLVWEQPHSTLANQQHQWHLCWGSNPSTFWVLLSDFRGSNPQMDPGKAASWAPILISMLF